MLKCLEWSSCINFKITRVHSYVRMLSFKITSSCNVSLALLQAMVLGANSNYDFSFPVKNSIDLLGVTIDKDLSFNRHISQICEKVNKQFSVLKRFKNIITGNVMLRLYKAFNIALLFGIFLALEIVINWSL